MDSKQETNKDISLQNKIEQRHPEKKLVHVAGKCIVTTGTVTEEHAEEDSTDQLDNILDKMRRHVDIPAEVDGQWFITFDDDTEVANTLADREIAESFPRGTDNEVDDVPLTVVTASDTIKALDVLYHYAYQVCDSQCLITSLNTVEKLIECNVLESVQ